MRRGGGTTGRGIEQRRQEDHRHAPFHHPGSDRRAGRRTALVVVDTQNGYRREDTFHACCAMAKRVVPAVNRLAGALRAAGGAVTDAEHAASPIAFHLRFGDVLTASECIAGFASEARAA